MNVLKRNSRTLHSVLETKSLAASNRRYKRSGPHSAKQSTHLVDISGRAILPETILDRELDMAFFSDLELVLEGRHEAVTLGDRRARVSTWVTAPGRYE